MSNSVQDISATPGLILKAARDELQLTLAHVADELHLRVSVVRAMEEEDYAEFGGDVFLKGYFRSYCRLVDLHEERMIGILEKQLNCRHIEKEKIASIEKKALKSIARKKGYVVMALLALIIALCVYLGSYFYVGGNDPETVSKPEITMNMINDAKEGIQNTGVSDPKTIDAYKPGAEIDARKNTSSSKRIEQESAKSKKILSAEMRSEKILSEKIVPEERTSEEIVSSSFESIFTGDCWFKLKDAKAKTVFAALKHSGDSISYSGLAPYEVILGDASKVEIVFEGEKVNLKPYTTKNGRAKFTLTSRFKPNANQILAR